jgi:hypothetical protein
MKTSIIEQTFTAINVYLNGKKAQLGAGKEFNI